jgi:anti-sigma factor RsiW
MNIVQLQHLLDTHGSDPSGWPPDARAAAERLIAADPAAAAALQHARQLGALLTRHMGLAQHDAAAEASASRMMAALAPPLPRQHRAWRWWPAALAAFDFAPAWPRIAALASIAVVGFAFGLVGLGGTIGGGLGAASPDADVSAIVFDPESITGLRP